MPEILKIRKTASARAVFTRAAEILALGGILAYPTETFYGLGVDARNEEAIDKIYRAKGRNFTSPLSVIIDKIENLTGLVSEIPDQALVLMQKFWPGPLTIVFTAAPGLPASLTAQTGKIGVRVPGHPLARELAALFGGPLTATSANLSGAQACTTAQEVLLQLDDKIDAVVDGGKTAGGKGSTIIDVTVVPAKILREGIISRITVKKFIAVK